METLRCLISDISQKLLSDIILRVTRQHDGIEVVDYIADTKELRSILKEQSIDVLILGFEQNCFSDFCRDLLDEFSGLVIVGLVDDGRLAVVYLDDVGTQDIIDIVQKFGKRGKE